MKLFMVEDSDVVRRSLREILADVAGICIVGEAEDAKAAEGAILALKPDVVTLDIQLPNGSGISVLKCIKRDLPDTVVIVLTNFPYPQYQDACLRAGADHFLDKSAEFQKLPDVLRNLTGHTDTNTTNDTQRQRHIQRIHPERLSTLGRMAGGIAHDFNNALMPIVGLAEFLLHHTDTLDNKTKTISTIGEIHRAAQDACGIVRRLSELYRSSEPKRLPVDINELIQETIVLTEPMWSSEMSSRGLTIDVTADLAPLPDVYCSELEIREALMNTIINAIDAMQDHGQIFVRSRERDGAAVLEVTDTGCGMPEEVRQECLEPFFTTKGANGTGLGLAQVCSIMSRHNGHIEVDSELGCGTTIRMWIPLGKADATEHQHASPAPSTIPKPLTVLIIDDDVGTRRLLARLLVADNHSFEAVESGYDALKRFSERPFDLVITDQAMSGMSGTDVAKSLSDTPQHPPVILLTGFGKFLEDGDNPPPGVSLVLGKPLSRNELRQAIASVMQPL